MAPERPRRAAPLAVVWSVVGAATRHEARLESIDRRRVRLAGDVTAAVGEEIRIELPGPAGAPGALGLGWVAVAVGGSMEVEIVCLGVDAALLGALANLVASGPPPPSPR